VASQESEKELLGQAALQAIRADQAGVSLENAYLFKADFKEDSLWLFG
jgi:hypothetical protein